MSDIKPSAWIVSNRNNKEVVTRNEKWLAEICADDESIVVRPLYKEEDILPFLEKQPHRRDDTEDWTIIKPAPVECSWPDTENLLHVIGQDDPHDNVYIVGTEEGLKQLRNAIDGALSKPGKPMYASVMCDDGEGYRAIIRCVSGQKMSNAPFGYASDGFKNERPFPDWFLSLDGLERS